jgi:predicted amidohydrolase
MASRPRAAVGAASSEHLSVGVIQSAPLFGRTDDNLQRLKESIDEVAGVDLAVSPELSAHGYQCASGDPWPALSAHDARMERLADHVGAVGVGFAELQPGGGLRNAYSIIGHGIETIQHKLHPVSYPPWNEHLTFGPGTELEVYDVAGARCATMICNDMWHPVAPWAAVTAGAEVLVVPVASGCLEDSAQVQRTWDVIIEHTARALSCFVVFVNRCGTDGDTTFWGGSRVVGPDGTERLRLDVNEASARVELDLAEVRTARRARPFHTEHNTAYLRSLLSAGRPTRVEGDRV